jgi:tetratricopeptide (TPR) repeat protein
LYRATLAAVPAAKLAVAKYFARRGNTLEALPILKSELSDKTLAEISLVGAQAVRDRKLTTGIVDPAECKLVLSWFDQARTRGNVPLSLASAEATLLDAVGQTADAERIYRGVLAQPNLPPLLRAESANNLAYLLAISGRDLREAQEHIDFALTQFGPDPKLLDTQAMVALGKDNAAEAIKLLTEATNVDATPDLFFHLALAYQKADDRGAAIRSLVRARQEGLREQALSAPEQKRLGQLDVWLKVPVVGNK